LGTEGYSPRLLRKAVRQGGKAASFKEASDDLRELAEVTMSPTHVRRLSERVGQEWAQARDADVAAYRAGELPRDYAEAPKAAAVMLDGGRYQTRAAAAGRGVSDPGWKETKVACCLTYAAKPSAVDPQPRPPAKFLDQEQVTRLVREMGERTGGRRASPAAGKPKPKGQRRRKRRRRLKPLVRTVVATTVENEGFGWQVATEVHRRGLDRATRKACLGDGSQGIWALFEFHLLAMGFIGILDFVHLLVHLYAAAGAAEGHGSDAAWALYTQWVCWAWAGKVVLLVGALRALCQRLGAAPADAAEEDPRRVAAETLTYLQNNRTRIDYPRYRCQGLPVSSAPVESAIKQVNRRVKGSEKFWLKGQAEAILQVRAAYLSEDDRAARYWARPRPYARAAGAGRLRRPPRAPQ
jgi:hypothetical protein